MELNCILNLSANQKHVFSQVLVEQTILKTNSVFLCCQTHEDFKREHLDRIDNDLMQTKLVLVDITESRRLCLQELGLRKNFVIWVKEALEGTRGDHLYLQESNLSVISH